MITGLFKGFSYVGQGFSLITQPGISSFVAIPLLINSLLFGAGTWLLVKQLNDWTLYLLPDWLEWLEWFLMPVFIILIIFVVFYTFTLIANLISAPFNSILAERIEARLNGLPIPEFAGYGSIPALITRTFKSELSKLWYLATWGIVLIILTLIPVVNLIAPIAWTLFGAWMLAIEYADYPMGNHNLFFKEQKAALQKNLPEAMGFGWILSLMTSIPVLNFLAMPVGVAGATALWVDKLSKPSN